MSLPTRVRATGAALGLALVLPGPPCADAVHAKVPDQEVEITLDIPGFEAERELPNPEKTLLFGNLEDGGTLSLLYEENFPFLVGAELAKRRSSAQHYQSFQAGECACCEFDMELAGGAVKQQHFYAFLATADFLFTLHVSVTAPAKGTPKGFGREGFAKLAKSLTVKGRTDVGTKDLPPELYAFRDEASLGGSDQIAWTTKQCAARADQWAPHYYLALLGNETQKDELLVRGAARAAELLNALPDRTDKQTLALLKACDMAGGVHAAKREYAKAVRWGEMIVSQTSPVGPENQRKYREMAYFNLAGCYAKTAQPDKAMECLSEALRVRPDLREQASKSELLKPLRARADFKKLVGG